MRSRSKSIDASVPWIHGSSFSSMTSNPLLPDCFWQGWVLWPTESLIGFGAKAHLRMKPRLLLPAIFLILVLVFAEVPTGYAQLGLSIGVSTEVLNSEGILTSNVAARQMFSANGRIFLFFINNTHYVYTSSLDNINFQPVTNIRKADSLSAQAQSVYYDSANAKVHWVGLKDSTNIGLAFIAYRRGTISGSTINWSAEVNVTSDVFEDVPNISADTNGRPFISYSAFVRTANPNGGDTKIYSIRATDLNGITWNSKTELASRSGSETYTSIIIPLANQRMYFIYCISGSDISGKLWNGNSFGQEDLITSSSLPVSSEPYCSASKDGNNNINLAFTRRSGQGDQVKFDIVYVRRINSWSTETVIATNQGYQAAPTIVTDTSILGANTPFVAWFQGNDLKISKRNVDGTFTTDVLTSLSRTPNSRTIGFMPTVDVLGAVKVLNIYWVEAYDHLISTTVTGLP